MGTEGFFTGHNVPVVVVEKQPQLDSAERLHKIVGKRSDLVNSGVFGRMELSVKFINPASSLVKLFQDLLPGGLKVTR